MTDAFIDDYGDEPDEPKHACWLITFADDTEQRVGAWPPMSRAEVMETYRCTDAKPT